MRMRLVLLLLTSLAGCGHLMAADASSLHSMSASEKADFFTGFIDSIGNHELYGNDELASIIQLAMDEDDEAILTPFFAALSFEALRFYHASRPSGDPRDSLYAGTADSMPRDFAGMGELKDFMISQVRAGLLDTSWLDEAKIPAWWLCHLPLSIYFARDGQVEALLLDGLAAYPQLLGDYLGFLNYGEFQSPATQKIRFEALHHMQPNVAAKAADGIALTSAEGGLPKLVAALYRRDESLASIVRAIEVYEDASLVALDALQDLLVELGNTHPSWNNYQRDVEEISRSVGSLTSLRAGER